MTIRTKEPEVPSEFPPARLFLDDIEEIVRILVDANEKKQKSTHPDKDAQIKVTLTIEDQVCDEVEELPKIAKKTFDLTVKVEVQKSLPETSLRFRRYGTSMGSIGFTTEEKLSIYHKLAPIFERRNLRWATVIHSHPTWSGNIYGAAGAALLMLLGISLSVLLFGKGGTITTYLSRHEATAWSLAAAVPILATLVIALKSANQRHSVIILRHSSEPSPLRQELLQKIPVAAITAVLTFLLTLLGFYLKHKYWP